MIYVLVKIKKKKSKKENVKFYGRFTDEGKIDSTLYISTFFKNMLYPKTVFFQTLFHLQTLYWTVLHVFHCELK